MSVIQLLPEHIANQIAAGEVVQRPASVVKEMVENAIDAGATAVKVIIKDAGRTLIQIIDDGVGMNESDAVMCFQRHATSKIRTANDLFQLTTKGFRGEALASIAAIAHVTLKTKHKDEPELGTRIEVEGNTIRVNEREVCPVGTSFEVKNIFYNVPARRNFLKSDNVEFNHIRDEFERVALAHPEVAFSLHHNGTKIHELPKSILRKRIVDIFGNSYLTKLIPITEETHIGRIEGFIGNPELARKTRGEQFFFVNNRFFKDSYFNHAVTMAYHGLIAEKTYPIYFIFLDIDPAKIDVNIHPTKTEIKFEDDKALYAILHSAVRDSLGRFNIAPTLDFEQETAFEVPYEQRKQPVVAPFISIDSNYNPFQSSQMKNSGGSRDYSSSEALQSKGFGSKKYSPEDWKNFYNVEEEDEKVEQMTIETEEIAQEKHHHFLFRFPYLISTTKSGLLVIHQQRAQQRIIFEAVNERFIHTPIASQTLLFPFEVPMQRTEADTWNANKSLLEQLGFVGRLEENTLFIEAMPDFLSDDNVPKLIEGMMDVMLYRSVDKADIAFHLVNEISVAAARRFKVDSQDVAQTLTEQLFQCEHHSVTPDGKKILHTLKLEELDKNF